MSVPPKPVQINPEDLGKEAPGWVGQLLGPLNVFMRDVVTALTGGLTRSQNLRSQVKELTITALNPVAGTFPITFQVSVPNPTAVWVAQCVPADASTDMSAAVAVNTWTTTPSGAVKVGFISGLTAGKTYTLSLIIE